VGVSALGVQRFAIITFRACRFVCINSVRQFPLCGVHSRARVRERANARRVSRHLPRAHPPLTNSSAPPLPLPTPAPAARSVPLERGELSSASRSYLTPNLPGPLPPPPPSLPFPIRGVRACWARSFPGRIDLCYPGIRVNGHFSPRYLFPAARQFANSRGIVRGIV
jgi:hypothetical protein